MINKIAPSVAEALAGTADGATVLIGGLGTAGISVELIDGLGEQGARDLNVVNNKSGNGDTGLSRLLETGRVRKIICSFPCRADSHVFDERYRTGRIELELVAQGNLAERLRAAGPASARSSRPPATARSWQPARRRGGSTAAIRCA